MHLDQKNSLFKQFSRSVFFSCNVEMCTKENNLKISAVYRLVYKNTLLGMVYNQIRP